MKINRMGCTRLVLELNTIVIKFPNFTHSWYNFICGFIANINESSTWKYNSGKYNKSGYESMLCPVLFTAIGGWFLVMKKVDKVLLDEDTHLLVDHPAGDMFGGDDKAQNYGLLEGRVVKIDYGCSTNW